MERVNGLSRSSRGKRKPLQKFSFSLLLLSLLLLSLLFISYLQNYPTFLFLGKTLTPQFPQCSSSGRGGVSQEKLLWYAPHSGFSNQLSELKNAILMAGILNRTLIVPPVLDHHAVALGSCPKFRVSSPPELRMAVWDHAIELLRNGRYVSMADIIDLSGLMSSTSIRTIDFQHFVSLWCGVDFDYTCFNGSIIQTSAIERLRQCGSLLSGINGNVEKCLYALDEDCRTVVWTYGRQGEDGLMDSFQPDEQLKRKKKDIHVRRRRDVYRTLGPGSQAELATVLAFGSLFTAPYKGSELYIDIHDTSNEQRIQHLIKKIKFLPFAPEIMSAGKEFAFKRIKAPFFCAQLRLLDGQFKNHWKATFMGLKQKLEPLRKQGPLPVHLFVMTDLAERNWTGNYLGDLAARADFKLHVMSGADDLVIETAKKVVAHWTRKRSLLLSKNIHTVRKARKNCPPQTLPDVLLHIEETVCSCASLGFFGTAGSTIAESIELMRNFGVCGDQSVT